MTAIADVILLCQPREAWSWCHARLAAGYHGSKSSVSEFDSSKDIVFVDIGPERTRVDDLAEEREGVYKSLPC